MYESFAHSPVLQHFTFSPTVLAILNANLDQLAPESDPYDLARFGRAASSETVQFGQQWKHILALHLRRGSDWEEVCDEKGRRAASVPAIPSTSAIADAWQPVRRLQQAAKSAGE